MAKKKITKRVSPKRVTRVSTRSTSSGNRSKGFFEQHKNLQWIIPLFVILAIALLVIHHFRDEREDKMVPNPVKTQIRSMLHLGTDNQEMSITGTPTTMPSDNSTITPFVTPTPTQRSSGY